MKYRPSVAEDVFVASPWALLPVCALLFGLAGCGKDASAPPSQAAAPSSSRTSAVNQDKTDTPQTTAVSEPALAASRSSKTKWIGGIPYDVFYDQPLQVASDGTALAAAVTSPNQPETGPKNSPTDTPSSPMPETSGGGTAPAASKGEVDWSDIAPLDQIVEEITEIRNRLQGKLNTVATYNRAYTEIGVDSVVLAALAGVVERHPGDVSWKPHAKYVRDLASEISLSAVKTGRSAFEEAKGPYESLVDILNGNSPPEIESEDKTSFGDYADRSSLMERMEQAHIHLKSNINTADRMKEDPETTKRKLTLLATLGTIVSSEDYDFTGEKDYQNFISSFINAAKQGRAAVDASDFDTYQQAIATMQTACNDCHGKYGTAGSDGF